MTFATGGARSPQEGSLDGPARSNLGALTSPRDSLIPSHDRGAPNG